MLNVRQNLKAAFGTALLLLSHSAEAWTGTADSYGFSVDTTSRNDVVSFWQGVYLKSEGYQNRVAWTGNYVSTAAGAEGTTSAAFVTDVERRANCIRALCGIPANVRFNTGATVNIDPADSYAPSGSTTKSAAAQRSALMIVRTVIDQSSGNALTHDPPTTCVGWTSAAWNANSKSELAYAFYGPTAVDNYFREDVSGISAWNVDVGHRRWLLNLQSTNMATGDTSGRRPESNSGTAMPPSNCLYVIPKTAELDPTATARFVPYPGKGFFPAPLNSPYWSLSYPGANFNTATVAMTAEGGGAVTTAIVSRRTGYGENAIVWQVPTSVAAKSFSSDTTYHVTVSGIAGAGVPTSYSYSVTLINPNKLTDLPGLAGTTTPNTAGAIYTFNRTEGSDSMEAGFFRPTESTWAEGAEDSPTPQIVDLTDLNYELRSTLAGYFRTGSKSFRLSLPTAYEPSIGGVPDQIFEIDREIVPSASATLNFYYRRGYMTTSTSLLVESSADGGVVWTTRGTVPGVSTNSPDPGFTAVAVPLPAAAVPLRIRFRLTYSSGSLYTIGAQPTLATGIFVDDISATNCLTLERRGAVESVSPITSVAFNSLTAGESLANAQTWWLRLRSKLGGKWQPYGPSLVVQTEGPLTEVLLPSGTATPLDTGATYDFLPVPGASSHTLDVAKLASVSWTEGAEASPTPKVLDQTGAYALVSTKFKKTGKNSFRLALDGDSDSIDTFEIDRDIVPKSGSNLTFQVKRGKMLTTNFIHAEVSTDGGSTWTSVWNQPGLTATPTAATADSAFSLKTLSLAAYVNQEIRIRFAFRKSSLATTIAAASKTDAGVWLDDISVSNANLVESRTRTTLAGDATSFDLDTDSASPGLIAGATYRLRLSATVAGVTGNWGTALPVVPKFSVPIVNWTEGAEASPAPQVVDQTGSYDLISTKYHKTGLRGFRLALDNASDPEDTFEINRIFVPSPGSTLSFQSRRGRMLATNSVHAEVSTDNGVTWVSLWSQNGLGTTLTSSTADKAFSAQSVSLAAYAARNMRVRFAFRNASPGNTITSVSRVDAGVWLDDISVSFSGLGSSGSSPGTVINDYTAWQSSEYPALQGQPFAGDLDGDGVPNGVEFAFSLDPTHAQASADLVVADPGTAVLKITRPLPVVRTSITYGAEWTDDLTTWSTEGVTVTTTGGQAIATAPMGAGNRFIRWKISQP